MNANLPLGCTDRDIEGPAMPHCETCDDEFNPEHDVEHDCPLCRHCTDCLEKYPWLNPTEE